MSFETAPFGQLFALPQKNGLTRPKAVRGFGLPMVNMGELFAYSRIQNLDMDLVQVGDKEAHFLLEPEDLLFARQSLVLAGAGQCSIFIENKFPTVFESHLIRCRLDKTVSNPYFYFYFFRSPVGRLAIETIAEQGAGASGIRGSDLVNLEVPCPPKAYQDDVAKILTALDDRITLLRETTATLEAIAKALFKSWFVDFDPVRAKLEGRTPEGMDEATAALFPDRFEESELGLVPRGWRVAQCQDFFEVRDGTHESPKPSLEGYPLVTSKHITSGRVNFQDTYLISESDYAAISKRSKVNRLDVLITMIGTVGLSAILLDDRNDFAIKNIGLFKTSAAPNFAYFLSLLLKSTRMQEYLSARLAGTTQKYLSLKALREIGLLVPPETVLVEFSKIASTLFDVIHRNSQQAQTLATLRDTLLPRLISGQLRLPEVAKASS